MDLEVPAASVRGQTRLAGLVEVAGHVYLDLDGELTIHDPHLLDVPGARSEAADLRSTYHRRLPVGSGVAEVDATLDVDLDVTATIALGSGREGKLTSSSRRETRRRYLPLD
jgi:hypothetical protein